MVDSESVSNNERELGNSQEENRQERQVGGQTRGGDGDRNVSNGEVVDSDSERLQGLRQHTLMEGESREKEFTEGSLQEEYGTKMADSDSERGRKGGRPNGKMQRMLGNHPDVRSPGGGTLNPTWVEWLMGYPKGWTDLNH